MSYITVIVFLQTRKHLQASTTCQQEKLSMLLLLKKERNATRLMCKIYIPVLFTLLYIKLIISYSDWPQAYREFQNQCLWHYLAIDYTIIMSRPLKITVIKSCHVWPRHIINLFLRVIVLYITYTKNNLPQECPLW